MKFVQYEVRSFVEEQIGEQYLGPLCGILGSAVEIDIDMLSDRCPIGGRRCCAGQASLRAVRKERRR